MKPKMVAIVVALAVLALAAWTAATGMRSDRLASASRSAGTAAGPLATDPRVGALEQSPQARLYRERQDFEAGSRRFLRDAAKLGPVERAKQARALSVSVDKYEREGGLSAGEALLLRIALLKATVPDEAEQALRTAELMQSYRARADRGFAEYLAQHQRDPRFQDYKARERAIVAEVMALQAIPGGLSRDEYLRQRLQLAREAAYR